MEKYLGFAAISVFLFSCTSIERDNPYDIRVSNYREDTSKEGSSSSAEVGNEPSSSGNEEPSSSSAVPSSSSVEPSSSSVAPSSSSVEPSSSSAEPSSSSVAPSSSSVASCTASDNSHTHYCSEGTMKSYGSVTDNDGKTYKTVVIGTQTWMAQNLNYAVSGSKCGNGSSLSDSNTESCDTYGRLYNWATAMNLASTCNSSSCSVQAKHRGVCPPDWHIPSDTDWDALMTAVGGSDTAGTQLKAKSGWNSYTGIENLDTYGFSALPGGSVGSDGSFSSVGDGGLWWSATGGSASFAYSRIMYYNYANVRRFEFNKTYLFSVRCLQD